MRPAIYTEKTQCRDCYKCIRRCPVKAIRVEESSATIDHELCIFCGRCVSICPAGAKKVRNDLPRARQLLALKKRVYLSLAPSFPVAWRKDPRRLVGAFEALGFAGVSETALGAELVAAAETERFAGAPSSTISSACPSVRVLTTRYFPAAAGALSPLPSPMVAHARLLRLWYGDEIGVVFVGPCIAKKMEADRYPELIDAALTFEEAQTWLASEQLTDDTARESDFTPYRPGEAALFPAEGGMLRAMENCAAPAGNRISQSGCAPIMDTLKNFSQLQDTESFLELLACEGGCINGPGIGSQKPAILRRGCISAPAPSGRTATASRPQVELSDLRWSLAPPRTARREEREIERALAGLGKASPEDRKECGGCGYDTCREFAIAFLDGKAEKEMCVTEMRRLAQHKASALLHTIPMGVVLVDAAMKIVECNRVFLQLFAELPFPADRKTLARAEGQSIARFLPDLDLFHLHLERPGTAERILKAGKKVVRGTFFQIRGGSLVGAVFQDITVPAVKRETVVRKAEEVIRKNLESVQQIAGLLGENAAETEIILNSLINSFQPGEVHEYGA